MKRRGRPRVRRELAVAMNGVEVGWLTRLSQGELQFRYVESWARRSDATPISLSMPLSTSAYKGELVWNWFDNLLPDSIDLRRRMQAALSADSTRPYDLLARAGLDCVGALQLLDPEAVDLETELARTRRIEAEPVSDERIAELLRDYVAHPLGLAPRSDQFRISIAGAQEKTALLRHEGRWQRPIGATPTTHLVKLPITSTVARIDLSDSVENEWLCSRIAAGFGLPVATTEMHRFDDVRALIVERFDRRWSKNGSWIIRLPQEDACQALGVGPAQKYESDGGPGIAALLDLCWRSQDPAADREIFLRALVVFWLLAAIDGHAKNFSLSLRPGNSFRFTPCYDILSAWPLVARRQIAVQELSMAMAVAGKNRHYRWQEIQARHWTSTARSARVPERDVSAVLADCAERGPRVLAQIASDLPEGYPAEVAEPILDGVEKTLRRLG